MDTEGTVWHLLPSVLLDTWRPYKCNREPLESQTVNISRCYPRHSYLIESKLAYLGNVVRLVGVEFC